MTGRGGHSSMPPIDKQGKALQVCFVVLESVCTCVKETTALQVLNTLWATHLQEFMVISTLDIVQQGTPGKHESTNYICHQSARMSCILGVPTAVRACRCLPVWPS